MGQIATLLGDTRPALSDGAIGTMLQAAGLMPGASPEIWNVERDDAMRVIHTAYADAGARLLTTNTFGGTRPRLALHGHEDRVHELNEAGARIARDVADACGALVLGSIGPTGDLMEPLGLLSHDDAVDLFAEQAGGLAAGGAHILLFETFSDLGEVRAGVEGARRAAPDLPVAVTMTFDLKGHTMMGVSPSQALAEISALGVELIGGNCGSGPDEIEAVMVTMSAERPDGVLLLAQSNAGLPQLVGDEFRYGGTPEVMADYAVRMQELGVDVIGSCCGSTPSHTAAMREALGLQHAVAVFGHAPRAASPPTAGTPTTAVGRPLPRRRARHPARTPREPARRRSRETAVAPPGRSRRVAAVRRPSPSALDRDRHGGAGVGGRLDVVAERLFRVRHVAKLAGADQLEHLGTVDHALAVVVTGLLIDRHSHGCTSASNSMWSSTGPVRPLTGRTTGGRS